MSEITYYQKNKEKLRKQNSEYYRKNLEENREKRRNYNRIHREKLCVGAKKWRDDNRLQCLVAYSDGKIECNCCKEKTLQFLSIDHIEGKGNIHRKETGGGSTTYRWLIKNNFPDGFQVLCHNCNLAKGFYGVCPHKDVV